MQNLEWVYLWLLFNKGLSEYLKKYNIGVNSLWPKTAISTAAVENHLGGKEAIKRSRKETIVSDAVYLIMTSDSKKITGNFFIVI